MEKGLFFHQIGTMYQFCYLSVNVLWDNVAVENNLQYVKNSGAVIYGELCVRYPAFKGVSLFVQQ